MSELLQWYADADENDNTQWAAPSCWHYEGSAFEWRLTPALVENEVLWIEAHDAELLDGDPQQWSDLEVAKAAIQKKHDDRCVAARADADA